MTVETPGADASEAGTDTSRQIRGSSLLTLGRSVSLVINFLAQVLIVRHLSQEGYGAFAYAISLVAVGESVVTLGLDRTITRFVPIYEERGQYDRLFGTLVLAGGVILCLGIALIFAVVGLQSWLAGSVIGDPELVTVLVILIALAPIQAYDGLLVGMFAVLGNAWAVFVRKHVLGPGLRLAVVGLLIGLNSDVQFLAAGYVIAGLIAVVLYTALLVHILARRGLLERLRSTGFTLPTREVLSFALPLLTSDLVFVVMTASDVVILEHFHDAAEVAAFRVVHPAAVLNQVVFTSFALLYTPLAARFFARGDAAGINQLYWRTATWMAVLSFPIFALTFSLAGPLTLTLYGEEYGDSAIYLAILSLGYYFNVALGFNGLTLKVMGRIKYIVTLNIAAAVANVVLNLVLIPAYGALGAAVGTTATLILHNILKQAGLRLSTGISLFDWSVLRVYVVIATALSSLVALSLFVELDAVTQLLAAGVATVTVLGLNRRVLRIGDTFPAVRRLPFARRLFGGDRD